MSFLFVQTSIGVYIRKTGDKFNVKMLVKIIQSLKIR